MKGLSVVTGAAQGIGAAVANHLLTLGHPTVAADLNSEGCPGFAKKLDLGDLECFPAWVAEVEAEHGPIEHLVNNAGVCFTKSIDEISVPTWLHTFQVNVHGTFFLLREVAERMKSRGRGSIVNVASVSAFLPKLEQVDYGASKAAVVSFTRSAALIYGPHGVRINAVAPGVIETPLTQSIAEERARIRGISPEETLEPVLKLTPLRRIGRTEEVAKLVEFLLSHESDFITGQTYDISGGFLMR